MSSRVLALLVCSLLAWAAPAAATDAKPAVAVLEVLGSQELKFEGVASPNFGTVLTIENQTKQVLKNVEIWGNGVHSPAGDVAALEFDPPTPFDLEVGIPQTVNVKVTLLNAGTYKGMITILQRADANGNAQAPAPLLRFSIVIVRTLAAPPVAINDIAALAHPSYPWPFGEQSPVALKMTIYATGDEFTLGSPLLDDVTRKPKADSASGWLASYVRLDPKKMPDHVTAVPGRPTPVELAIDGLASAGRYDGTIRFAPAGFQPVSKSFTIYVRDPAWVAIFFIALGVAGSLGVLTYTRTIRPRLQSQQQMTAILLTLRTESARAAGDADAATFVAAVRENVKRRWDDIQERRLAVTTELDVFESIASALGAWTQLHKQLREVQPVAVRDQLMPTLNGVRAVFENPRPDAERVKTAIADLLALPEKIRTGIREKLQEQLAVLTGQVQQHPLGVEAIAAAVRAASEELGHDNIQAAIELFEKARLEYARILAGQLIQHVRATGAGGPPYGMPGGEWEALAEATIRAATIVSATGDADEATTRLFAAAVPYVNRMSRAIEDRATESITDETRRQPIKDAAAAARTAVGKAAADGLNGLDEAAKLLDRETGGGGQRMGPSGAGLGFAAAPSFDVIGSFGYGPPASDLDVTGAERSTTRKIERYDVLVSIVVVVAACLIGLQVLWVDNPVWGGPASYLAAFIWGFAIDQFSHAGVAALRK